MTMQSSGIRVRILGDDSDLNKKLDDSRKAMDKWAKIAIAASVAAGAAIIKSTAASAKEITNLSRLVGEGTTAFQRNAAAAKSVGIESEKYADIMKDVQDKVGDFMSTGAGPMADFFEKIAPQVGVTANQFKRLNGRDALQLYVDSLEKANVSQNEMTFYLEAIASDAALLQPLLAEGGKGFEELGNRAQQAGAVLNEIDLAKMDLMQQSISESQELFKGLTNQIALQLAPVLQGVSDLFSDGVGGGADKMKKAVEKAFEFTLKGAGFVADGVRGIQVVVKGIESAFWGLSAVTAEVFEQIARGVDDYVVKPTIASINGMIDAVNKLPGIDLARLTTGTAPAVQALTAISDAATGKMKETAAELHDLLMEPLPSKALEDFVTLAQQKAEEAAKVIAETRNYAGIAIPEIPAAAEDPEVIAEQDKLDKMLSMYQAYGQARVESGEDFTATEAAKAKAFADEMKAIDAARFNDQLMGASSFFGDLSSLMDTESRTLFAIGKAAAVSQAVVDGISAAISSFKFGARLGGPILGGVFAAASAAATGVQIAALAATSFGSGSSGGSGSQAPPVSVPEAPRGQAAQGQSAEGLGQSSTLFVEGLSSGGIMSMIDVRVLANKLLDHQRDGGKVVLT